jgi:3-hydroxybutyryl-CoA dehydrogenase
MGPFGMMDLFGVNVIYDSWRYRREDPFSKSLRPGVLALLQPMIDNKELGMKTGSGFYHYPDPQYQHPGFLEQGAPVEFIYHSLLAALIANAALVAAADVVAPVDIDRPWKTGTYLDRRPFEILARLGVDSFLQILADEVAAGSLDSDRAERARNKLRSNSAQIERV